MAQRKQKGSKLLQLEGEMTIFNVANMREQLLQVMQAKQAVEVNLSKVSEFDTAGLQLMVAAKKMADAQHIPLKFTQAPEVVTELLQLSRMTMLAA